MPGPQEKEKPSTYSERRERRGPRASHLTKGERGKTPPKPENRATLRGEKSVVYPIGRRGTFLKEGNSV